MRKRTALFSTLTAIGIFQVAAYAAPVQMADNVQDFTSTQNVLNSEGFGTWQYGDYTNPFQPGNFSTSGVVYGTGGAPNTYSLNPCCSPWLLLGSGGFFHPDPSYYAVERFTDLSYTGSANISGSIFKRSSNTADAGVVGYIYVDNLLVDAITVNGGDTIGYNFNKAIHLNAGDTVDLVLGPAVANYVGNASTTFQATLVTATPEPSTVMLFAAGGLLVVIGRRKTSPLEA